MPRSTTPTLHPELQDYLTWQRLRERIISNQELAQPLRAEALAMTGQLETTLGALWPLRAFGSKRNSMTECFVNGAPHALRSMISAGQAITQLRDLPRWSSVVGRIPVEGEAAIAELRVAWRAVQLGMSVALGPRTDRGRSADVLVSAGEAQLFVEVFVAEPLPKIALDVEALENRIIPRFTPLSLDLTLGGRFFRAPSDEEVAPLAEAVTALFQAAHSASGLHELLVPGLLELRAARMDDPSHQSFVDRGLIGDFRGIVFNHSPVARLVTAIRGKSQQLPAAGSGMLVMTPPSFLGQPPATEEMVSVLKRVLSGIPHVVALALIGRQLAQPARAERYAMPNGAVLAQEVVEPPVVERVLFIPQGDPGARSPALELARRLMAGPTDR
jgi:hypothetical protein